MKTCFKCGERKPRSEFYPHRAMADGLLGKCKDCAKAYAAACRAADPETFRQRDRDRGSRPVRVALRKRVTAAWRAKYPERVRAEQAAANALRDGKLVRPSLCEGCGLPVRVEKHHPDYDQPLLVVWLCKPCHAIADKERRALEATG